MISCVIVDDEPQARKLLGTYLSDVPDCQVIKSCSNAIEAYQALHEQAVDLLFLDIKMSAVSGIDFLKSLKQAPLVIFTTAYPKYALEGFDLNVLDYLLKPISFTRLVQAVAKAKERLAVRSAATLPNKAAYIFVKQENKLVRVLLADILYLEGRQNYVKIHLRNKKSLLVNFTMKGFEELLPANDFIRIHRSYLVAISAIEAVGGNFLELTDVPLPIGAFYRENVMQMISSKKI